jgi:hypothetical protein
MALVYGDDRAMARREAPLALVDAGPMKTKDEAGFVIPEAVVDAVHASLTKSLASTLRLAGLPGPEPRRPLTLRQRFRLLRADVRWRFHDWLFGDCPASGDE